MLITHVFASHDESRRAFIVSTMAATGGHLSASYIPSPLMSVSKHPVSQSLERDSYSPSGCIANSMSNNEGKPHSWHVHHGHSVSNCNARTIIVTIIGVL